MESPTAQVGPAAGAELAIDKVLKAKQTDHDGGINLETRMDLAHEADLVNDKGYRRKGEETRIHAGQASAAAGIVQVGGDRVKGQMSD